MAVFRSIQQHVRELRAHPRPNLSARCILGLWEITKGLCSRFRGYQARRALSKRLVPDDIHGQMDLVFNAFGGFLRPLQVREELAELAAIVRKSNPQRILEIGTAKGGSLFSLCQNAAADAQIVSVDLPGGQFGGGYPEWKTDVYRRFAKPGQTLHLLRADSHADQTVQSVKDIFGGETVDVLFIDGDHTYQGVKHDFESYRHLVREGGLIGFHDINANDSDPEIEVDRLWDELRRRYSHTEIVHQKSGMGFGIGLLVYSARDAHVAPECSVFTAGEYHESAVGCAEST